MTLGTNELIQQLQVFPAASLAGKTVEQVSCLLPQSVLMNALTDNPEIEEMPLLDDPPPLTADPEPVRSQSRRWPARKLIFWSLVVIVVFFLVVGAAAIWLYQPPLAPVLTSTAESAESLMTAQEVVNAEPLPVSETVVQGQPGLSPDELESVPLPVGGSNESEEGLPLANTESEELLEEVKYQLRQNNDADLYFGRTSCGTSETCHLDTDRSDYRGRESREPHDRSGTENRRYVRSGANRPRAKFVYQFIGCSTIPADCH